MKEIDKDGTICYYNDKEQLHREDGPAAEYLDGTKYWYINGKRHRLNGPAAEYANGDKSWYVNGELHREDGPAYEYADGYKAWYLNSKKIDCKSQEEFLRLIKIGKAFL